MKITKTEKIWLLVVTLFYLAYNIPGLPAYGNAVGTILHGAICVIGIWTAVYVGLHKVNGIYELNDTESEEK